MKGRFLWLKNWWWYNKTYVLIGLLAATVAIYCVAPSPEPKPDYHIGLVSALPCTEAYLAEAERHITAAAEDLNGDGLVLIRLHPFTVDFHSQDPNAGYNNYEKVAALDADLTGKVSGLYLLQDPAAFQKATQSLMAEPFADFDETFSLALRKDAGEEYRKLFENLKQSTSA